MINYRKDTNIFKLYMYDMKHCVYVLLIKIINIIINNN